MLKELTEEQKAAFSTYVKKWIDIGTNTDELNVEKSLAALKLAYEQANLPFPDKHEVYDSPKAAIDAMKEKYDIDIVPDNFIFGAHDAHWLSFFNYFDEMCGITECKKLNPFMELAKHCGWVLTFDELVVLTHKPCSIKWDDEMHTHSEDSYAIEYRDGYGIAIWHGTRVPEEWILDRSSITPEVMLHWENVEQRRCACEIIGWAEVIKHLNAKVINKDADPTIGTLLEVDIPEIGVERFLVALDPNVGKEVGLSVPNEMETALEANSWTYGIDKFEFKPEFRV